MRLFIRQHKPRQTQTQTQKMLQRRLGVSGGLPHLIGIQGHWKALVERLKDANGVLAGVEIGHYEVQGRRTAKQSEVAVGSIELHQPHRPRTHSDTLCDKYNNISVIHFFGANSKNNSEGGEKK
jgi:hypothetical protein